jgi:bifunctional DNA-binding transcriptional regulator/antitoxin component of YhaV-PrlF toxin-antitoxin module
MAVQYFRTIDGLGRIVLPAELLHHLNWEKGKMSVSIEEKDGCLIVSSVPAAGQTPAPLSPVKPQDNPNGQSKIISLPVSKK